MLHYGLKAKSHTATAIKISNALSAAHRKHNVPPSFCLSRLFFVIEFKCQVPQHTGDGRMIFSEKGPHFFF